MKTTNKGQSALSSLLIIATIAVAVSLAIAVVATLERSMSTLAKNASRAFQIAETGLDDALIRLARDPGFNGTATPLPIDGGSYTIEVTNAGLNKIILAKGTVDEIVRKIQVTINMDENGKIVVLNWQEVQ